MKAMTIGQLARSTGVGVGTVRFYERRGLLDASARRAAGYRQYTEDVIRRLLFIKRDKELGLSLKEVADLIALRLAPSATRADVRRQAGKKLTAIGAKIRDLQHMSEILAKLVAACDGQSI